MLRCVTTGYTLYDVDAVERFGQGRTRPHGSLHALVGLPPRAICGAGMVITRIPGDFNPSARASCFGCAVQLAPADDVYREDAVG